MLYLSSINICQDSSNQFHAENNCYHDKELERVNNVNHQKCNHHHYYQHYLLFMPPQADIQSRLEKKQQSFAWKCTQMCNDNPKKLKLCLENDIL